MSKKLALVACAALVSSLAAPAWLYAVRAAAPRPMSQAPERTSSRIMYFGDSGFSGQFMVSYGSPVWKGEYERAFDDMPKGQRVRLGKDYWTTLDTSVTLKIGRTKLKPGLYYLCLEKAKDGFSVLALNPDEVRKGQFASFRLPPKGGTAIALSAEKGNSNEEKLRMGFIEGDGGMSFQINWGPYVLTAPVEPGV